jgi:branched-chain amino acid transport system substrate-binding protein
MPLRCVALIKDPTDPQWARTADFLEWKTFMPSAYPAGNLTQFENAYAYAAAKRSRASPEQYGDDLTRANIMRQAASLRDVEAPMLLPGIRVNTSPSDNFLVQSMRLQRFKGEIWQLFGDVLLNKAARR